MSSSRQGFGRQSNKANGNGNGNTSQQKGANTQNSSPTSYTPTNSQLATSASFPSTLGSSVENGSNSNDFQADVEPTKFFFKEKYARLGVKGNFMPLAAQPKNVDLGEWLAHQGLSVIRCTTRCFTDNLFTKRSNNIGLLRLCFNVSRKSIAILDYPSVIRKLARSCQRDGKGLLSLLPSSNSADF